MPIPGTSIEEPFSTIKSIQDTVTQDPNLRYDPNLTSRYLSLGGTLINNAIPEQAPQSPAVITPQLAKTEVDKVQAELSKYQQTGTLPSGEKLYFDPVTKTSVPESMLKAKLQTAEDKILERDFEASKTDAQRQFESDLAESNAIFEPLKARLEANKQFQITTIQNQYARLLKAQEQANARRVKLQETIGIRFGGRYTPEHTADLVKEQVDLGIQEIAKLNSEEAEAIGKIQSAFDEKSYALALKEYENLKDVRKTRDDKLKEIEKTQREGLQKIKDDIKAEQKINDDTIWNISVVASQNTANFKPTKDYKTVDEALLAIQQGGKTGTKEEALLIAEQTGLTKPPVAQSDFEQAFFREHNRYPTPEELLDFKRKEAEAGRAPEKPKKFEPSSIGLTSIEVGRLETVGLDRDVYTNITRLILGGITNERIKEILKESGIDEDALDKYDRAVGIEEVKKKPKSKGWITIDANAINEAINVEE